ncbi:MAG: hypothetical protein K0S09_2820 [Sphingobacteriaceae bacterium]|nr:hypothetical protein [Sphingobacteriaceae bacterium]
MQKVYIDNLIFSLQDAGGISRYWQEFSGRLFENRDYDVNLLVYKFPGSFKRSNTNRLLLKLGRFLPIFKQLPPGSIIHSSYLKFSLQSNIIKISTIHDLAAELGYLSGVRAFVRNIHQKLVIKNSDVIICVSNTTRRDLLKTYKFLSPEKVFVVHHGVSNIFRRNVESTAGLSKNILIVGSRKMYKNYSVVLKALSELPEYNLIMVGGGELTVGEKRQLKATLRNRYQHLLKVTDEELNILYNQSFALIYSSLYEGFGLPVLEAMKSGCPVITTTCGAIPEIVNGDKNAFLVDNPSSKDSYIQAIRFFEQPINRELHIKNAIKNAEKFCWDKSFQETLAIYHQATGMINTTSQPKP